MDKNSLSPFHCRGEREKSSMRNRITIANPNGTGYRIPGCRASSIRLEWQQEQTVLFGTVADRLGEYEDLGSVEELRELKRGR